MIMLSIEGLNCLVKHLIKNMSKGISNFEIEKIFKEIIMRILMKIALVFFPLYPFIISNTDRSDENGAH